MRALGVFLLAAAVPLGAIAQGAPVIGYLGAESAEAYASRVAAFRRGLAEMNYVEGRNLTVEYRWALGDNSRLPILAAELVKQRVSVLVATGSAPGSIAAKNATSTIPVVFEMGLDPVEIGLVQTMNRPGGNVTGVTSLNAQISSKRLQFLRDIVRGGSFALLVNPTNPRNADAATSDVEAAARRGRFEVHIARATNQQELAAAFKDLAGRRVGGLVIANDPFFVHRSKELAALSLSAAIPAVHQSRDFVQAGGLLSYGSDPADSHRVAGLYAGRILNGEKPGDLPIQQGVRLQLFVNLKTAKTLGLTVPQSVLLSADGVIQ